MSSGPTTLPDSGEWDVRSWRRRLPRLRDARLRSKLALFVVVPVAAVFALAPVRLLSPGALGAGDVKLAVPLGAVLGAVSYGALALGAILASGLSLLVGLTRPDGGIPHGLGLLASTWLLAVFLL